MRYYVKCDDHLKSLKSFLTVARTQHDRYIEIKYGDNILKTSINHKLIIDNTIVYSRQLKVGMKLNNQKIYSVKLVNKPIMLYDLIDVEDDHLYTANGITHHNCEFLSSDALLINSAALLTLRPNKLLHQDRGVKFYQYPNPSRSYVIGCDVAEGVGRDYSTIEVVELPTMEQIAEFRDNNISPNNFYLLIKWLISKIRQMSNGTPEIFWSYENNTVGNVITALYTNDENFPDSYLMGDEGFGYKTSSSKIKLQACLDLKNLVERTKEGRLIINSKEFLSELSTFASTNTGFSAKKGSHDDLISAMLIVTRIIKDISSDDDKLFDIFYNYVEDEIEPMAYCV